MKTPLILCLLGAMAAAAVGLKLGWPAEAQQAYYRAHNEVERLAFGKEGSEEVKAAVTHERAAEKNLFVTRDLGRRLVWLSVGFSAAALFVAALAKPKPKA